MKKLFLLFLVFNLAVACSRHESPSPEDGYRRIQTLIDQKQYQEAETEARGLLEANPNDQRARMILASIYVSEAGISLTDFFDLEALGHIDQEKTKPILDVTKLDQLKASESKDVTEAADFINKINSVASDFQIISEKFEKIPVVSEESAKSLYLAIQEMNKIENPENGNGLYRGVIKLFYFKYLWKTGQFVQFGGQKFCSLQVSDLAKKLELFRVYTAGMLRDVSMGFPKNGPEFLKQINEVDSKFRMALIWVKHSEYADKNIQDIIEKLALDHSVQGFKCDF